MPRNNLVIQCILFTLFVLPTVNRKSACSELADRTNSKRSWEKRGTIHTLPLHLWFRVTMNIAGQSHIWANVHRLITGLLCENRRCCGGDQKSSNMILELLKRYKMTESSSPSFYHLQCSNSRLMVQYNTMDKKLHLETTVIWITAQLCIY